MHPSLFGYFNELADRTVSCTPTAKCLRNGDLNVWLSVVTNDNGTQEAASLSFGKVRPRHHGCVWDLSSSANERYTVASL